MPVDLKECPEYERRRGGTSHCRCGKCAECGHPKHSAIHACVHGQPDKVWGHEFVPQAEVRAAMERA